MRLFASRLLSKSICRSCMKEMSSSWVFFVLISYLVDGAYCVCWSATNVEKYSITKWKSWIWGSIQVSEVKVVNDKNVFIQSFHISTVLMLQMFHIELNQTVSLMCWRVWTKSLGHVVAVHWKALIFNQGRVSIMGNFQLLCSVKRVNVYLTRV